MINFMLCTTLYSAESQWENNFVVEFLQPNGDFARVKGILIKNFFCVYKICIGGHIMGGGRVKICFVEFRQTKWFFA